MSFFVSQEYPPGVMIVPMRSRTLKPFTTTNLVVFAPENVSVDDQERDFVIHGDALIVDPGCHYKLHIEVCHKSMCSFFSSYHISFVSLGVRNVFTNSSHHLQRSGVYVYHYKLFITALLCLDPAQENC